MTALPMSSLMSVVRTSHGGGRDKAGSKHGGGEQDDRLMGMQRALEDIASTDPDASDLARSAYVSFMRAYATHPRATKHIFHTKALHFGHVASSFALREPPSRIQTEVVKRTRERDAVPWLKGAKGRGGAGGAGGGGSVQRVGHKRKGGQGEATKERAAFVKKRRQLGYDADARLGLSAI